MNLLELKRKEKMINNFENVKECLQFENNLYDLYGKGGIEKKVCDHLKSFSLRKRGSLRYEQYVTKAWISDENAYPCFSKAVYEDFMVCLEVYEELVCVNGHANRIRRKMNEKGIGKTLVDMVGSKSKKDSFLKLEAKGLLDYSMESVVVRNFREFNAELVSICREKLGMK